MKNGKLNRCFGIVCSSNGMVLGSIEFRGEETSNLLALLQMSREIRVIDCSQKGASKCPDEWRDELEAERTDTPGMAST